MAQMIKIKLSSVRGVIYTYTNNVMVSILYQKMTGYVIPAKYSSLRAVVSLALFVYRREVL